MQLNSPLIRYYESRDVVVEIQYEFSCQWKYREEAGTRITICETKKIV